MHVGVACRGVPSAGGGWLCVGAMQGAGGALRLIADRLAPFVLGFRHAWPHAHLQGDMGKTWMHENGNECVRCNKAPLSWVVHAAYAHNWRHSQ